MSKPYETFHETVGVSPILFRKNKNKVHLALSSTESVKEDIRNSAKNGVKFESSRRLFDVNRSIKEKR